MAARLVSLIVAEGVALDQFTARLTAFNMIDSVLVTEVPARLVRAAVVGTYELDGEPESFIERVRVVAPNGETATTSELPIFLAARAPNQLPCTHRSIHMLWSTPLNHQGDYRVMLDRRPHDSEQWTEVSDVRVTVAIQPHPVLNAAATSVRAPA